MAVDSEFGLISKSIFKSRQSNLGVKILNTDFLTDQYLFKVLELSTHEDTGEMSEVRVAFQFVHSLIRPSSAMNTDQLDWDVAQNPKQILHLSRSTRKMMEITNDQMATIYYRDQISDEPGQIIQWKVLKRIKKLPRLMTKMTSVPFLFSPEFNYQIDFIYMLKIFVIVDLNTEEIVCRIPEDLLELKIEGVSEKIAFRILCSKIAFHEEKVLKIINKFDVECFFRMDLDREHLEATGKRQFKLVLLSANKLDNQFTNKTELNCRHETFDKAVL